MLNMYGKYQISFQKVSPSGGKWSFLLTLNGMLGGMVAQVCGLRLLKEEAIQ